MRRSFLLLTLVLASAAAAMTAVPSASAKQPCWRTLFVDYADGRIDGTYPLHCYREAVQNLQEDTKIYGRAAADINRALAQAITRLKDKGTPFGPNTIIPPNGGGKGGGPGSANSSSRNKHDEGIFYRLVHAIGPTNADSVPLPLLILAGLAFLLLAGAATSLVVRRVQARRPPPPGAPPPSL